MRNFCESLREHSVKISNFENKKMIPLTNKEYKSYLNQINGHLCKKKKKKIKDKYANDKNYRKFKDPCHYKGKYRGFSNYICKFKGSIPKEIPMFFLMNRTMIIIFLL